MDVIRRGVFVPYASRKHLMQKFEFLTIHHRYFEGKEGIKSQQLSNVMA